MLSCARHWTWIRLRWVSTSRSSPSRARAVRGRWAEFWSGAEIEVRNNAKQLGKCQEHASCWFQWGSLVGYIIYIHIFQASDLGLVKDTPVWPSPISSCVGPPLHKSQLIRCPYKIRNYVWFFLVRHGPLVKPWWHRTCSPLVTYDFVHQVLCVYVM